MQGAPFGFPVPFVEVGGVAVVTAGLMGLLFGSAVLAVEGADADAVAVAVAVAGTGSGLVAGLVAAILPADFSVVGATPFELVRTTTTARIVATSASAPAIEKTSPNRRRLDAVAGAGTLG